MGTTLIEEPGRELDRKSGGTTLIEPGRSGTQLAAPVSDEPVSAAPEGLVVGWLVVLVGPGRGSSRAIGYGMNSVGRASSNRVALDFGDSQISSEDHFRVAYDGENRRFHIVPGRGANLVYLGDAPLLGPQELDPAVDIRVGATVLRFVPFCTAAWDWSATSGA